MQPRLTTRRYLLQTRHAIVANLMRLSTQYLLKLFLQHGVHTDHLLMLIPHGRATGKGGGTASNTWGMMVSRDLSAARPMALVSTPSMATTPLSQSTIRKSTCMSVLFPLPVRPTMPIFSPGL